MSRTRRCQAPPEKVRKAWTFLNPGGINAADNGRDTLFFWLLRFQCIQDYESWSRDLFRPRVWTLDLDECERSSAMLAARECRPRVISSGSTWDKDRFVKRRFCSGASKMEGCGIRGPGMSELSAVVESGEPKGMFKGRTRVKRTREWRLGIADPIRLTLACCVLCGAGVPQSSAQVSR